MWHIRDKRKKNIDYGAKIEIINWNYKNYEF